MPANLPKKLVDLLRYAAGHKDNECVLDGRRARQVLDALHLDWDPEIEKCRDVTGAVRAFKAAVRTKFGAKNVKFGEGHGRSLMVHIEGPWAADFLHRAVKASGLARFFYNGASFEVNVPGTYRIDRK